jgi:Cft2 family RNA processing exonuclease
MPAPTLRAISGVGLKGPACFLLEADGKRLMFDLGEGPPPGLLPNVDDVGRIDALVLSHGHADHVGGLSLLPRLGNPPVYATDIVARRPNDIPAEVAVHALPFGGRTEVLGIAVQTGRNGHAPGGIWLRFDIGDGLIYTGDYSVESLIYAYDPPPPAGALLLDCSYGEYDVPLAQCWQKLAPLVDGGAVLLPAPANGRGPELALQLARAGHPEIFADEPHRAALRRLANGERVSLRDGVAGELARLAETVRPIEGARGIMLAAAAHGASGESARLIAQWEHAKAPAIVLTGHVPKGTPAERLRDAGRAPFVRWNVHPRLADNVALVRATGARTVIAAFCDRAQLPALSAALAPARVTMDTPVEL